MVWFGSVRSTGDSAEYFSKKLTLFTLSGVRRPDLRA